MKIENLIKYWDKVQLGLQEDDTARRKHYKMVAEALAEYKKLSEIDNSTDVIRVEYNEAIDLLYGNCKSCETFVNSNWDFCPHCGRPLRFDKSRLKVKKKSTASGHNKTNIQKKGDKEDGKRTVRSKI